MTDLTSFTADLADGRTVTVDATDEDQARRLAREQAGGVGVLTVAPTEVSETDNQGDEFDAMDREQLVAEAEALGIDTESDGSLADGSLSVDELRDALRNASKSDDSSES